MLMSAAQFVRSMNIAIEVELVKRAPQCSLVIRSA